MCLHTQVGCCMIAKNNSELACWDICMGEKVLVIDTQLEKHAHVSMFNWSKVKIMDVGVDPPISLFSTSKYLQFP